MPKKNQLNKYFAAKIVVKFYLNHTSMVRMIVVLILSTSQTGLILMICKIK
jgi:hypothetical protein